MARMNMLADVAAQVAAAETGFLTQWQAEHVQLATMVVTRSVRKENFLLKLSNGQGVR